MQQCQFPFHGAENVKSNLWTLQNSDGVSHRIYTADCSIIETGFEMRIDKKNAAVELFKAYLRRSTLVVLSVPGSPQTWRYTSITHTWLKPVGLFLGEGGDKKEQRGQEEI